VQVGGFVPPGLVAPRFGLDGIMQAYDTFADADETSGLIVILKGRGADWRRSRNDL
jgi:hypothetical protein